VPGKQKILPFCLGNGINLGQGDITCLVLELPKNEETCNVAMPALGNIVGKDHIWMKDMPTLVKQTRKLYCFLPATVYAPHVSQDLPVCIIIVTTKVQESVLFKELLNNALFLS